MKTIVCIVLATASLAWGKNLADNGGFEDGLQAWQWGVSGDAKATGEIDTQVRHEGTNSFKMTSTSAAQPNVYGGLGRTIGGLVPNTKYRASLWCRGQSVGPAWFGGGPGWMLRTPIPAGTYDWKPVKFEFTTGPEQTDFHLRANIDGPAEGLWIDDVQFVQAGPMGAPTAKVETGLSSADRVYPAMAEGKTDQSPPVKILSSDSSFGGEVQMAWNLKGFQIKIRVIDPTEDPVGEGVGMWQADSVQIAIDTQPEEKKSGYTESCFELGLALRGKNEVLHTAWQVGKSGKFDWSKVVTIGSRVPGGWHFFLDIPWTSLELEPGKIPTRLGVNVLFNESNQGRRYVEWTPGIGQIKRPSEYVRVILIGLDRQRSVADLAVNRTSYEKDQTVVARYMEYAIGELPAGQIKLTAAADDNKSEVELAGAALPKVSPNQKRTVNFYFPADQLVREGRYRLIAKADDSILAQTPLVRTNLRPQIQAQLKRVQNRMAAISQALNANPAMVRDPYVDLGITIAGRFVNRLTSRKQDPEWELLQAREMDWVLDQTQKHIDAGRVMSVPRPEAGPVEMRDGVFYTAKDQPYFFYGYGAFGMVETDIPEFWKYGATLIQREHGPSSLNSDYQAPEAIAWAQGLLKRAAENRTKVDLLLSPHYYPEGLAPTLDPGDKPVENPGFIKFNIDHPNARKVIQKWLEEIIPAVKDQPGLFSACLSNEPTYSNSGRDKHSRPLWIEFLKQRHKTIEALNQLYGTSYKEFAEVPVPSLQRPMEEKPLRAYYDWIVFNQEHFADWHAWMNGIIKKIAPDLRTSSKVMNTIFDQMNLSIGTDPELFCRVTDLAGNDSSAYLATDGPYAYQWIYEQVWYDLLNSFRGRSVFNSENHLIPDRTPAEHIPPEHTYCLLWQGALHHQGATVIWIWEETDDSTSDLAGSIYFRPANIYGAGKAMFDLNRLARQVAAINQTPPRVAILYSIPSLFWETDYADTVKALYAELMFLGQPVTFVSERQLTEGTAPKVDLILLPHATHVKDPAFKALNELFLKGQKVLAVGSGSLTFDEYHRPRQNLKQIPITDQFNLPADETKLAGMLRPLLANYGLPLVELTDLETKTNARGVEFRVVPYQNSTLVPMTNMLKKPRTVKLNLPGQAVDLIAGEPVDQNNLAMEPMKPRLLRISK